MEPSSTPRSRNPRVTIVGAGMSGIAMGIELLNAGFDDFVILEKGEKVGGVWLWNHYPGLSCDVPSQLYQFGFHLKPNWNRVFAKGNEIRDYLDEVVDAFNLRSKIRFGTEVTGAQFNGAGWDIQTSDGQELESDFVVMATGLLHHPNRPDVPGLDQFNGRALHSADWDDSVSVEGKRVVVVGTGSTGVQLVSAFQREADHVTLFARNPQWVVWAPTGAKVNPRLIKLLERFPPLNKLLYKSYIQLSRVYTDAVMRPTWRRRLLQRQVRKGLSSIRDPELRAKLTPDYEPFCKRQVVSGTFYSAVQKPNVEVVSEGIERIEPSGVVDTAGTLHECDVIAFATGFQAHNYMRPMNLVGRDGLTIDEAWNDGPRAYLMSAIPGFPNLFTMLGPNSPVGSLPLHHVAQRSAVYIVNWLERYARGEFDTLEVTEPATASFNAELRVGLEPTVWNTGCNSWYFKEGGTVDLWPFNRKNLDRRLASPVTSHFRLERVSTLAK